MIYVLAAVGLASAIAAGIGTWQVQEWRHGNIELKRVQAAQRETLRRVDKIDASAEKHEKVKEVIRTKFVPITERVEHEVTKVEFRDRQCWNDDSLRIVADAIAAIAPTPSVSAPAVSGLKPLRRWFGGSNP